MKREPLTRGEKILAVASLAVVTVLVGGMAWLQRINAEPRIDFPSPVVMPSPNGFDAYVAAGKAIASWKPPVDPVSDSDVVQDPTVRAQRYGLARREAWLKANARGFALFKKAMSLPCRHPDRLAAVNSRLFPSYAKLRELARCKTAEANTFKLRGDWNAAMQSGLDTMQMGIDIPRGGAATGRLVGSAYTAIGKSSIEDVPEHLNAVEAKAAMHRLEKLIVRRVSFADALKQEKWWQLNDFLVYTRTENWRQSSPHAGGSPFQNWIRRHCASKTGIATQIQKSIANGLVDVQSPFSAPMASDPRDYGDPDDPFSTMYGTYFRLRFSQARESTGLNMLLLRLALHAYTLDHGTAPAKLAQLVPGYLKTVPRDIFADDKPLHYVATGKTYRLWSVGPDMKDDAGRPVAAEKSQTQHTPSEPASVFPDSLGDWVAGKNR